MKPSVCPICGAATHVTETRASGENIRRRRRCQRLTCSGRLTTIEIVVPTRESSIDYVLVSRDKLRAVAGHLADVLQEQVGATDGEVGR